MICIYTDGSYRRPGNVGAYGYIKVDMLTDKIIGQDIQTKFKTTNNEMELKAIQLALQSLGDTSTQCTIYTDSQYCIFALTKWIFGWMKYNWLTCNNEPVKNKELLLATYKLLKKHIVTLTWVKGHNGDKYNEKIDTLVQDASKKLMDSVTPLNILTTTTLLPSKYFVHIAEDDYTL